MMKKTSGFLVLFLVFFIGFIIVFLCLYPKFHSYGRTYIANLYSIGYEMKMEECYHDSVLHFVFNKVDCNKDECIELYIYNRCCDGIEFVFQEGSDTIYIREKPKLYEEFPPNEQYMWNDPVYDENRGVIQPVVFGNLPSKCKLITYSDSNFFKYESEFSDSCIPVNDNINIISIWHNCDRGSVYELCNYTRKKSKTIQLNEHGIQYIKI